MLTIDHVAMEPVGEGTNQQEKLVAHFKEPNSKLLVVTPTKYDAISLIAQSDETEDWPGVKIVLEAGKPVSRQARRQHQHQSPAHKPAPQRCRLLQSQNPILTTSSDAELWRGFLQFLQAAE